eukprot:900004_1
MTIWTLKQKAVELYQYLKWKLSINITLYGKTVRFNLLSPSEDYIKQQCLQKLLEIHQDPQQNRSKTSSIALAIEGSDVLLPYLEYKYTKSENISWPEYFEECTHMRIFLINELVKLGHDKYINDTDRFGNSPLIFSCALKEPRLVECLLSHGALITQPLKCKYCRCKLDHQYNPSESEQRILTALSSNSDDEDEEDGDGSDSLYCKHHVHEQKK